MNRDDPESDLHNQHDRKFFKSMKKRAPTLDQRPSGLQRLASKLRSGSKKALNSEQLREGREEHSLSPYDPPRQLTSASSLRGGGGAEGGRTGRSRGLQDLASTTAARIRLFEEGAFSLDSDMGSLSEKGLENLRGDLAQLDGEVLEDLRKAVHQQYSLFIRASPGILRLESEVATLRGQLQSMGQVILSMSSVSESVAQAQRGAAQGEDQGAGALHDAESAWRGSAEGSRWKEHLDDCDMAIAERRIPEALQLVQKLERLAERAGARAEGEAGGGESLAQQRWALPHVKNKTKKINIVRLLSQIILNR